MIKVYSIYVPNIINLRQIVYDILNNSQLFLTDPRKHLTLTVIH